MCHVHQEVHLSRSLCEIVIDIFFNFTAKVYTTISSLVQALEDKEVDGIMIDSFVAGENKDILGKTTIHAVKLIEYPSIMDLSYPDH